MELRLIMLAMRLFDPRRWRARLVQGGVAATAVTYIVVRAVNDADVARAVRGERRARRNVEFERRLAERTERYLAGGEAT